jgi:uncharacterized Zn-binding protein involved in type VI secretion
VRRRQCGDCGRAFKTYGPEGKKLSILLALLLSLEAAPGCVLGQSASAALGGIVPGGLSASQRVVYASTIAVATGGQAVTPGNSAIGDTDSATALNAVLAAGNTKLILDSGYALSKSLVLYSGDTLECVSRMDGVIMMVNSNATPVINAHQNPPTVASGTGGYLVSNQTDQHIAIRHCTLNANSTQAVTGNNVLGTPHAVNPATGLFVYGAEMVGVEDLMFDDDDVYDTGAFVTLFANDSHVSLTRNFFHQPAPVVAKKNTDGPHFVGPDRYIYEVGNTIVAGDDSLPFNADDGNRTGSGDPNAPYVANFVKWGWITDVFVDNNSIDGSSFGLRLYSATELLDRIEISNTSGIVCGNTAELAKVGPHNLGNGNIGTIRIDGWQVATTGACNSYSQHYNFVITSNYTSLQINGLQITNPGVNWPVITHNVVAPGILSLRNWDLSTPSSSAFSVVSFTGGSAPQVAASGMQWLDNSNNTGTFFAGTVVPSVLTCSNYSGPDRLLASGFAPVVKNGDCFTNSYPLRRDLPKPGIQ